MMIVCVCVCVCVCACVYVCMYVCMYVCILKAWVPGQRLIYMGAICKGSTTPKITRFQIFKILSKISRFSKDIKISQITF